MRRSPRISLLAFVCAACCVQGVVTADDEFFEKHIRPILVKRCYKCHSGTKTSGGLALDSRAAWQAGGDNGPVIVAGDSEASLLIRAINYQGVQMPPEDAGGKLSDEEIAALTKWVEDGATDPRIIQPSIGGMSIADAKSWWAFQSLADSDQDVTPEHIDELIDFEIHRHDLSAVPKADRRTLIRRATYDLTGLPPTVEDVDQFLADESPDAFSKAVERLLSSSQYGVKWGRHWLDVVRYADTAGENTDRPLPHAWRYRNWVLEAFRRDMPFDEFVRLQLSGDLVASEASDAERREGIIATGYLAIARRFGHDIDKDIHLMHEDVIDNIGKNFLGLTLGCARCHDHKYDPVTARDYYALYGIFASTKFSFPGCEPKGQPRDLIPLMNSAEATAQTLAYEKQLAAFEQQTQASPERIQRLRELAVESNRVLAESTVGEGKAVKIQEHSDGPLDRLELRKGDVLQLTVLPNDNHGADTTRVELEITRNGDQQSHWNVADLIPGFTNGGPAIVQNGATWCFLDVTDGPAFLVDKKLNLQGQDDLHAWASGDLPSAMVNASPDPVSVWTTLPGSTLFVHPGPRQDVAVAWVCPEAGAYQIRGVVADAHPAGLDGVSFRFEHFASAEYGAGLIELGKMASAPKPPRPVPPVIPMAYAVTESTPKNERLHERGDPELPGDTIPRGWLSVFGGAQVADDAASGRRELADWIIEQPLFTRVMANRVWQWHFGRGLVATPNDFGSRGEMVTHPALLDLLAAEFKASGYSIKALHRLIMTSEAYQRGSVATEKDPGNRWLSGFSRRRLSAEEIRDSLLMMSGELDLSAAEAHPFPAESTWKFTQHDPFNAVYETNRRSVFLMVQRQRRHPFLALFDGADPNSSTPGRQSTTVPAQALYFLNDPFFHRQAESLVKSLPVQQAVRECVDAVFRRLFQRQPADAEVEIAERLLEAHPGQEQEKWSAYARVLMASNEFLYVD